MLYVNQIAISVIRDLKIVVRSCQRQIPYQMAKTRINCQSRLILNTCIRVFLAIPQFHLVNSLDQNKVVQSVYIMSLSFTRHFNSFNKMIFTSSFFLFLICFCLIFFFFSNTRSLACPNTAQTHHHYHHHQVFPILSLGALIKYKYFTINECHRSNSRIFKGICKGRSTEFSHNHKIFKQN